MKSQKTKTIDSQEETTLSKIKSGEFRQCYLIYNRKSTDEPENQKNSIKYQKAENTRFAYKEKLSIAYISLKGFCLDGIISEKHSGFKEDTDLIFGENGTVKFRIERPKFYQLVQFLSKGYFKGVIILCWDRASRNKGDDTVIRKLMKQGIDFRFTLASYDKTSSGALHMDIDGMFAEHHSRVTSEKVKINIRNKREQGYCTHKAPVGYLNLGSMENKPVDPIRGPIISRMYELYVTGEWSLSDLARWATDQGFTMQPARRRRTEEERLEEDEDNGENRIEAVARPPTFNRIHNILTNRFYLGEIKNTDGSYIKSKSQQPLVTVELFNRVQTVLTKKKVSVHYIQRLEYPLRGMIRCGGCLRVYTPYNQKGITYYGCRCSINCENSYRNTNLNEVLNLIGSLIKSLSFSDKELKEIEERSVTDISQLETERSNKAEENNRRMKRLVEDISYLKGNKLILLKSGAYSPEGIVEEEVKLNSELQQLQEKVSTFDGSLEEIVQDVVKLSELLKTLYLHYEMANPYEKEQMIKIIFSELYLFGKDLKYKCKNGFQALESRLIPICAQTTWLSELQKYHIPIKQSITELETIHNLSP